MRVNFTFGYDTPCTEGQRDALNATGLTPPIELTDEGKINGYYTPRTADLAAVLAIMPGATLAVDGVADAHALRDLADVMERIEALVRSRIADPEAYVNNRVDVHVPGNALLAIDEVDVQTDLCTDELGRFIAEGWRIVAVCPQPDQRRPDYVLGRRAPVSVEAF